MRYIKLLIATVLISLSARGYAQGTFSIVNISNSFSHDTIAMTQSMSFIVVLTNTAPATVFNGDIDFFVGVDTMNTGGNVAGNIDTLFTTSLTGIFIQAGDSISHTDSIFISPNAFKGGINTVVIWPVANFGSGFATTDSAKHDIYVLQSMGLKSSALKHPIIIGPNPFSEKIQLISDAKNPIEQVRFLNTQGQIILTKKFGKDNTIDTSELKAGIYFLEVIQIDGKTSIIKTIKE